MARMQAGRQADRQADKYIDKRRGSSGRVLEEQPCANQNKDPPSGEWWEKIYKIVFYNFSC